MVSIKNTDFTRRYTYKRVVCGYPPNATTSHFWKNSEAVLGYIECPHAGLYHQNRHEHT